MIRFAELYYQARFPQALALLHQWRGLAPLLHEAASFYHMQLHRHSEAVAYLHDAESDHRNSSSRCRSVTRLAVLASWLAQLGYPLEVFGKRVW